MPEREVAERVVIIHIGGGGEAYSVVSRPFLNLGRTVSCRVTNSAEGEPSGCSRDQLKLTNHRSGMAEYGVDNCES